jgi:ubiquitin C-terminal hydrolase
MNKIECLNCNSCSYAFDNFMDLSLSFSRSASRITGNVSLEDCIKSFTNPERMEQCGYKCEKCGKLDNMSKELTIFRFPKILVIHLKRFYNSYMRREKLNTTINIPTSLRIGSYAKHSSKH